MRLIDADALKFDIMCVYGGNPQYLNWLNHAPTVDAVPVRHGKWTRKNNYGIWECSECGCKVNRSNPLKGNIWNYYYCPNCGARMDEE